MHKFNNVRFEGFYVTVNTTSELEDHMVRTVNHDYLLFIATKSISISNATKVEEN